MKIIQLVANESVLVALADNGRAYRLSHDGTVWYELPPITESTPLPPANLRPQVEFTPLEVA